MPVLIGELEKITGSPSSVTQVMVRAHETRITGSALTTDELVPIPVDQQGRFEVPLRPGKAVLVLVHGGRVGEGERFPMLVEEGLGTITSAIKLASDRFDEYEINELEQAAADMLASLEKSLVAATRAEVAKEDAEGHAKDAAKDAGRAETIQRELPTKIGQELDTRVPAELDKYLPGELDERVPPLVADSLADDLTVADAAAAAVEGAVDEAMPTKADTEYVDAQDQALADQITGLHHYRGNGFPEGRVTAPVGSIYTDRQATAGAVRWIKTQGTGNTGWQVEYGDTGWRSIAVEELFSTGKILVRRINRTIYLNAGEGNFRLFTLADQSATHLSVIPPSFRPEGTEFLAVRFDSGKGLAGLFELGHSGYVRPRMLAEYGDLSTRLQAETASWPATTLWPSTLPGIPS